MATIVLSAAGLALGGSLSGSILGLSTAVVGRAIGATVGRVIDQRLLGSGSEPVETGRIDRFRLTGASEGAPVQRVYGRMRVAGQVIWASRFRESSTTSGGGKGAPRTPTTTQYSYSVSLAIALCEGKVRRIGRIWADGIEQPRNTLNFRVYDGSETQLPDPKMEAVEGVGNVPAYRGIAYVVFEDLELGAFGNRIPQFTFEVVRPTETGLSDNDANISDFIQGVSLVPGTGEYALATTPVYQQVRFGERSAVNLNSPSGKTDLATSLEDLTSELPALTSVSLIVSWFGGDLRCSHCDIKPKVEKVQNNFATMPWVVSGQSRATATPVPQLEGRPVYGGTPSDGSVIEAIHAINQSGKQAVFYPFILMDQLSGNTLPDPWGEGAEQPALPWRGRITLDLAPGMDGTADGTLSAADQVAAFFGTAQRTQFAVAGKTITYSGPAEWSYRRFILHYAHLCAAAGGVSAFCLGSELRSLTQIRGAAGNFPAVTALKALAADLRQILGPECKIGYAADWSEYHGYQPPGTSDKLFHLDPLWSDANVDFIGIDNYMPLSDWRDGDDHLDARWGSIYNLDYLRANIAGGEGFDWFYHSPEARNAQIRTPIADFWGEDWVWRVKDLAGWWSNAHHNRINGDRSEVATDWLPQSKPIWFTELGCAAVDRGTNQPNKFLDPKSSESGLPYYSRGFRDEFIQVQYLRAMHQHFAQPANNPVSVSYDGPIVDMSRAHVWAWDARPYPFFPANTELWTDGANYARGHWLNGRTSALTLASVVGDICRHSGLVDIETSRLYGIVRGYTISDVQSGRASLQGLMLVHGFDVVDRDGLLAFVTRHGHGPVDLSLESIAEASEGPSLESSRAPDAEVSGRVRIGFVDADGDYETRSAEAIFADEHSLSVASSEFPVVLTRGEGRALAERWLSEARVARETARFALPPSKSFLGAGDLIRFKDAPDTGIFRIDRIEQAEQQVIDAVRIEPSIYEPHETDEDLIALRAFVAPVPVEGLFLDLPLIRGDEVEHAPYFTASAAQWPGAVALYSSSQDSGYGLNALYRQPAILGMTETPLFRQRSGLWDRGPVLRVQLVRGELAAASVQDILSGANIAAIGDGTPDNWELFQFADVQLVGPRTYEIGMRLRGQFGTNGAAPTDWPTGSVFVLLNEAVSQINLPANARDVLQHYRFGPASRAIDDPSFDHVATAFKGNGLRPYSVCHLRSTGAGGQTVTATWVRRTRIDGDTWTGVDVSLGEAREAYQVKVIQNGAVRRITEVATPSFVYPAANQAADGISGPFLIEVAQISDRFGAGPAQGIVVEG